MTDAINERAREIVTAWFREQWPNSTNLDPHVDCDYGKLTKHIARALADAEQRAVSPCRASATSDPPQDCDMPFCGCNPAWHDALEAACESGWLTNREASDLERHLADARRALERVRECLAAEDIENDPDDLYTGRAHRLAMFDGIALAPSPPGGAEGTPA